MKITETVQKGSLVFTELHLDIFFESLYAKGNLFKCAVWFYRCMGSTIAVRDGKIEVEEIN